MASTGPWSNGSIFVPVKAFVKVTPRTPRGPEFMILHAQPNFHSTFKYLIADTPLPISALFCNASDRRVVSDLERALVEGRAMTAYLNLQDKDHVVMSCHLSLISSASMFASTSGSAKVRSRFTVITIRSASVIGNCSAIGLMMSEIPRGPSALLEARVGVPRAAEADLSRAEVTVHQEPEPASVEIVSTGKESEAGADAECPV